MKGSNTTNLFQHLCDHRPLSLAELAPSQSSSKLIKGRGTWKNLFSDYCVIFSLGGMKTQDAIFKLFGIR